MLDTHESEQSLADKKFKIIVNNDKNLDALKNTAEQIINHIKGKIDVSGSF